MLVLRRHLLPLLRADSPFPARIYHRACHLSTSTSVPAAPFSLEDYLVAACGLAPAQAHTAAQKAFNETSKANKKPFEEIPNCRLNSASNPDAVLALLSGVGLSRADIAAIVVAEPLLAQEHRPPPSCSPRPPRVVKPNIALLGQCGASVRQIAQHNSRELGFSPECLKVKELVLHTEELGVPRSSRMFWHAVTVISQNSKEKVAARLLFLKSTLGCHESEVATAVSKLPPILGISEECLHRKIQFLINVVGLEPQYIVQRPALFTYSLEKRLVPRHCVMKVLLAKGLLDSNRSFYTLVQYGEETFKLRYIDNHKDSVPGLADAYATACGGVVPSAV
ncbi:unnamed protein product [Urochloa decumbens]|uniref:Uncharacterized protein n=1 Tax=Urochloa decumbens TaxID=240449 RepID=A0ABC9DRD5_9POAL